MRHVKRIGIAALAMGVIIVAAIGIATPQPETPVVRPIFSKVTPAANPSGLIVQADGRKIFGWIAGLPNYVGKEAKISVGNRTETVLVQRDHTFTWHYKKIDKPVEATVTVDRWTRTIQLTPQGKSQPSVFFVVDRTAYRPGQPVKFVGFLRELTEGGRFEPLGGRAVNVELRSFK